MGKLTLREAAVHVQSHELPPLWSRGQPYMFYKCHGEFQWRRPALANKQEMGHVLGREEFQEEARFTPP